MALSAFYVEYWVKAGTSKKVGETIRAQNQLDVLRIIKMRPGFLSICKYPTRV